MKEEGAARVLLWVLLVLHNKACGSAGPPLTRMNVHALLAFQIAIAP
jgi:hypothetical protein